MDRQDILAERSVEKGRGYMPAVSANPGRLLFTAGLTGRNPDGSIAVGDMAAQTRKVAVRCPRVNYLPVRSL
jgi:enamine deaminase RidA (YjgF/YER057c/UK114 family)